MIAICQPSTGRGGSGYWMQGRSHTGRVTMYRHKQPHSPPWATCLCWDGGRKPEQTDPRTVQCTSGTIQTPAKDVSPWTAPRSGAELRHLFWNLLCPRGRIWHLSNTSNKCKQPFEHIAPLHVVHTPEICVDPSAAHFLSVFDVFAQP